MNSVHATLVGRDRRARRARPIGRFLLLLILFASICTANGNPVIIGSKKFTESYVLGEIAKRTLMDPGIPGNIARAWAVRLFSGKRFAADKSMSTRNTPGQLP